ncbi:MAG: hypothetical protein AB1489_30780 [Acidobacteriota bacterium]
MSGISLEFGKPPSLLDTTVGELSQVSDEASGLLSSVSSNDHGSSEFPKELTLRPRRKNKAIKETKLPDEQIIRIGEEYKAGKNCRQLAQEFSVSLGTIVNYLDKYNVVRRLNYETQYSLNDAQTLELCQRYRRGEKASVLAKEFNISARTFYTILKRNNVVTHLAKQMAAEKARRKARASAKPKRKVRAVATKRSRSVQRVRSTGSAKTKRSAQGVRIASRAKTKAKVGRPANTRVVSRRSKVKSRVSKTGRSKR